METFHTFGTTSHLVAKRNQNSCKPFKHFIDPTDVTVQTFHCRSILAFEEGHETHWGAVKVGATHATFLM